MDRTTALQIMATPEFKELIRARRRITLPLLLLITTAYFGFILMVAFDPAALGVPLFGGLTSIGIYFGIGLLFLSFAITGFYIRQNNRYIQNLLVTIRANAAGGK